MKQLLGMFKIKSKEDAKRVAEEIAAAVEKHKDKIKTQTSETPSETPAVTQADIDEDFGTEEKPVYRVDDGLFFRWWQNKSGVGVTAQVKKDGVWKKTNSDSFWHANFFGYPPEEDKNIRGTAGKDWDLK